MATSASKKWLKRQASRFNWLLIPLGGLAISLPLIPLFPNSVPSSSALVMLQSLIEVNGVLLGFSGIIVSIFGLSRGKRPKVRTMMAYMFGIVLVFFVAFYYDFLDLAEMGTSLGKANMIRDFVLTILFILILMYLSAEVYRETMPEKDKKSDNP